MKITKFLAALMFAMTAFVFVACEDDDDPEPEPTDIEVSGTVSNAEDGSGLADVSVDAGSANATTDADGNYSVTAPKAGLLSFSKEGFVSKNEDVNNRSTIDVALTAEDMTPEGPVTLTENITEDMTFTSDKVWILGGRIAVVDGVTLTIEPGTIIKGEFGEGPNSTALIVARGAKIMAEGTEDLPIIFTALSDEISPEQVQGGDFASPNISPTTSGLWGGLIVLGKAVISASSENGDISETQIEGIPTSDTNGLYGGDDDEDNSGILKYISIRHGGTEIGAGNEINGLTLGGVGRGTIIENIEVISNLDDGIEWFGGTVDVKNVVVWNVDDDGIDTDQSWSGTLDNFAVITPGGHCFELDGPEGSYEAGFTLRNGAIVASTEERRAADLINVDENTICDLENLFFTSISDGQQVNRINSPDVNMTGIEFNVTGDIADYINGDLPERWDIKAVDAPSVGPDVSVFGWTWTHQAGILEQ